MIIKIWRVGSVGVARRQICILKFKYFYKDNNENNKAESFLDAEEKNERDVRNRNRSISSILWINFEIHLI